MKMFRVVVNGNEYEVGIEELKEGKATQPTQAKTMSPPKPITPQPAARVEPAKAAIPGTTGETIVAPMPGTILRVDVSIGASVAKGDTLLILEAMKMENEILAPSDGVVEQLNVSQGASVNPGDILVVLAP